MTEQHFFLQDFEDNLNQMYSDLEDAKAYFIQYDTMIDYIESTQGWIKYLLDNLQQLRYDAIDELNNELE
ncbi:MAG TPA: hypothetical protein V6C85_25320 [Allocoleopsis sp.]